MIPTKNKTKTKTEILSRVVTFSGLVLVDFSSIIVRCFFQNRFDAVMAIHLLFPGALPFLMIFDNFTYAIITSAWKDLNPNFSSLMNLLSVLSSSN